MNTTKNYSTGQTVRTNRVLGQTSWADLATVLEVSETSVLIKYTQAGRGPQLVRRTAGKVRPA